MRTLENPRLLLRLLPWLLVLVALAVFVCFPLLWMICCAFKPSPELFAETQSLLPKAGTIDSFRRLASGSYFTYFGNSLYVAVVSAGITTAVAASGAYVLARSSTRLADALGSASLFMYMFAPVMLMIPVYIIIRRIGLTNNRWGLVLAHCSFCLPFALWTLRSFFAALPAQLEERALADGVSPMRSLLVVVLPLTMPGLVTTGLFAFILSWNEYVFARILIGRDAAKTLPIGIEDMFYTSYVDWGEIMAAGTTTLIPAIVIVALTQRQLRRGWLRSWQ